MQLAMVFRDDDTTGYISPDGRTVLRREKNRLGWVLRENGKEIDNGTYRNDIAEKYNFSLSVLHPDYINC